MPTGKPASKFVANRLVVWGDDDEGRIPRIPLRRLGVRCWNKNGRAITIAARDKIKPLRNMWEE